MATRNERRKRAKRAFIERQSMRLIREDKAKTGAIRDKVMAIVKANLSRKESLCPVEDRAWLGKGCSTVYQPGRAIGASRYGNGKTLSVLSEGLTRGKVRGKSSDVTY